MSIREWRADHSIRLHALVPLWACVPERARWRIVHALNRSQRVCWCDLVDAALWPNDLDDPCYGKLPILNSAAARRCRTECSTKDCTDHTECRCYCGKFRIEAEATEDPS